MSDIKVSHNLRPMCDVKGCDLFSTMHGLWGNKCWGCYSRWMLAWMAPKEAVKDQFSLDFGSDE